MHVGRKERQRDVRAGHSLSSTTCDGRDGARPPPRSDLLLRAFAVGRKTPLFNRLLEPPGVFVVGRAVTTAISNFFCIVGFSFFFPECGAKHRPSPKVPSRGMRRKSASMAVELAVEAIARERMKRLARHGAYSCRAWTRREKSRNPLTVAQAISLFWLGTGRTARHPRRRNNRGRIRLRNWCRFYYFGVDTGRSLDHAPAGVQFVA